MVSNHRVFDAFGNRLSETAGGEGTIFGYAGREWEEVAELQFNRARWYDSRIGRWISQDPIGFAAGDANLYRYVGNQVTTLVDPSGLEEGIAIAAHGQPYVPAGRYRDVPHNLLTSGDPQRQALMNDAEAVGLGDIIKEMLIAADKSGPRYGLRLQFYAALRKFSPHGLQGPCGTWVVYASPRILETASASRPDVDVESYIIEKYPLAKGDDIQNTIRVAFRGQDGNLAEYFLDDGQVGGSGGVFDRKQADSFKCSPGEKPNDPRESSTSSNTGLGDGIPRHNFPPR